MKAFFQSAVTGLIFLGALVSHAHGQDIITVCHRTGSDKNDFERIQVNVKALPSHLAHGDRPDAFGCVFSLGRGEGQVDLLAWEGYAESGKIDPNVDWVTPFEKATGCKVRPHYVTSSDEMKALAEKGGFDLVSAGGDIGVALIREGMVVPLNSSLLIHYQEIFPELLKLPHAKDGSAVYGAPIGRGENALLWREDQINPAPTSWGLVYDPNSPEVAKSLIWDNSFSIAEAALYLKATRPELGISDPYELDSNQFDAVMELLKARQAKGGAYWSLFSDEVDAFTNGSALIGSGWRITADFISFNGAPIQTTKPQEGMTAFDDAWMVSKDIKHPNCAYRWIDYFISASVNAQESEWFGQAPSNQHACDFVQDPDFCSRYHATDENYWSGVEYWKTPMKDCGDARGDVCKNAEDWAEAWGNLRK